MKKNIQKRWAQPKRSIADPGHDHELGLWIDHDILRRQQNRPSQTILHDPMMSTNNRYLELADLALGNGKPKKKSKGLVRGNEMFLRHLDVLRTQPVRNGPKPRTGARTDRERNSSE